MSASITGKCEICGGLVRNGAAICMHCKDPCACTGCTTLQAPDGNVYCTKHRDNPELRSGVLTCDRCDASMPYGAHSETRICASCRKRCKSWKCVLLELITGCGWCGTHQRDPDLRRAQPSCERCGEPMLRNKTGRAVLCVRCKRRCSVAGCGDKETSDGLGFCHGHSGRIAA